MVEDDALRAQLWNALAESDALCGEWCNANRNLHNRLNDRAVEAMLPVVRGLLRTQMARVEALAVKWETLSDMDPFDPCNPGGYGAELRAVLP